MPEALRPESRGLSGSESLGARARNLKRVILMDPCRLDEDRWLLIVKSSHDLFCKCPYGWKKHLDLLCGTGDDGGDRREGGGEGCGDGEEADAAMAAAVDAIEDASGGG